MGLVVSSKGGNFPIAPAGIHLARCYMVIDLGTQPDSYMGKPKETHKVRIGFELPTEKYTFFEEKGPEPFSLSKKYTASLGDKAILRKELESWRGKPFLPEELTGFDISKLLGAACMVNVTHKQKKEGGHFAQISAITPLMAQMKAQMPAPITKPILFVTDEEVKYRKENGGKPSPVFLSLPDWIREEISKAFEISGEPTTQGADATPQSDDDSAPF